MAIVNVISIAKGTVRVAWLVIRRTQNSSIIRTRMNSNARTWEVDRLDATFDVLLSKCEVTHVRHAVQCTIRVL